ncbi:MAG TPA: NifU family protein [Gemmatimonadaceae bacterium]|jgi:Fe-S cluster biogenesis protein NfuA
MSLSDHEARARVAQLDHLLERVEGIDDDTARQTALAAVQGLVELYGEGLSRVVTHVNHACDDTASASLANAFAGDELVSHLLMLHGLHPDDLHARVEAALDDVRPYLASHGGNVELVAIDGGVARVRLTGSCHGCAASELTLRARVDEAVLAAAPELRAVESDKPVEVTHVHSEAGTADAPVFVPIRRAKHSRATTEEPASVAVL